MKTLKFYDNLIDLILSGDKTSTWRLFDDKDLHVGDKLRLINKMSGEDFAMAQIIQIKEKRLKALTDEDFEGHERYATTEKMLEAFREMYGDKVTLETIVKMIDFELMKAE